MINLLKPMRTITLSLAMIFGGLAPTMSHAHSQSYMAPEAGTTISIKVATAKMSLRDLFLDHIYWTRSASLSLLTPPSAMYQTSAEMSQENIKNLGKFVEPYCGAEKAQAFMDLFVEHYNLVIQFTNAVVAANVDEMSSSEKLLYENGDKIANFLSTENEFIIKDEVLLAFKTHIMHHLDQVKMLKAGDYAAEAKLWTNMKAHVYAMADCMVMAMAQKYPDKF
jgi:hypothetical protein